MEHKFIITFELQTRIPTTTTASYIYFKYLIAKAGWTLKKVHQEAVYHMLHMRITATAAPSVCQLLHYCTIFTSS